MILTENQIKEILSKSPKFMKNKFDNTFINQIEFQEKELFNLIQTYIYEKKNIDIGEIKNVKGEMCPSFIDFQINVLKRNHITALQNSNDYNALDYASNYVINYYNNKYKENENRV
jgi:hypothetical protein